MKKKIMCLCSGGLDSFSLAHFFKSRKYDIIILYVNYGQLNYNQEFKVVKKIVEILNIENLIKIDLSNYGNFFSNSLVIKYELLNDYFPGRNLLLLTIAV
jgi:7-cyano-7-deazaguanine synthase